MGKFKRDEEFERFNKKLQLTGDKLNIAYAAFISGWSCGYLEGMADMDKRSDESNKGEEK